MSGARYICSFGWALCRCRSRARRAAPALRRRAAGELPCRSLGAPGCGTHTTQAHMPLLLAASRPLQCNTQPRPGWGFPSGTPLRISHTGKCAQIPWPHMCTGRSVTSTFVRATPVIKSLAQSALPIFLLVKNIPQYHTCASHSPTAFAGTLSLKHPLMLY